MAQGTGCSDQELGGQRPDPEAPKLGSRGMEGVGLGVESRTPVS